MFDAEQTRPSELELALTAAARHKDFHRRLEAAAAALHAPPAVEAPTIAPPSAPDPDPPVAIVVAEVWPIPLSMLHIKQTTCEYFGVSVSEVVSARRTKHIINPRHVAVYLCKELTPYSLPAIGRAFGGRDHTTILHSLRRINNLLIRRNPVITAAVSKIRARLEAAL